MRKTRTGPGSLAAVKLIFFLLSFSVFFLACNDSHVNVTDKEIVAKPEEINAKAEDVIQGTLKDYLKNSEELGDSFYIKNAALVQWIYDRKSFHPLWSDSGHFNKNGDSLFSLIATARSFGLFPEDYYENKLGLLRDQLTLDTSSKNKLDASVWAYSDMLLTSAFVQIIKDLRVGRLLPDSVIAKDSVMTPEFFLSQLSLYPYGNNANFASKLEPAHTDYLKLKQGLRNFLDSADFVNYTLVNTTDSTQIPRLLYQRIREEDSTLPPNIVPDSATLKRAIKSYQKLKGLKQDGKVSESLINYVNDNDRERFIRIAINLDRYKQLAPLPEQYLWVNIPSYYLQMRDSDTVVLTSRIVVGKPITKTPIITSAISDMITYPKWTIPESIVKKEILPGLQRDPGYTISKGYSIIDEDGNEVDPYHVNWQKYTKGYIPYKVVQGSGDANALGVLKFNFPNKYAVYLHDTNQRYLFSKKSRALSHGCVRVQAWDELAKYILRNDSTYSTNPVPVDSLTTWLAAKQKRYIPVRKPIPLFIRYFTCDAKNERLVFYEDIYGEDKRIREKVFADK